MSIGDVDELVKSAVESRRVDPSDPVDTGGAGAFVFNPNKNGFDYGIENMRVIVTENGEVVSVYPDSGPSVLKYDDGWISNPAPDGADADAVTAAQNIFPD